MLQGIKGPLLDTRQENAPLLAASSRNKQAGFLPEVCMGARGLRLHSSFGNSQVKPFRDSRISTYNSQFEDFKGSAMFFVKERLTN
jgi:hypothetical protein